MIIQDLRKPEEKAADQPLSTKEVQRFLNGERNDRVIKIVFLVMLGIGGIFYAATNMDYARLELFLPIAEIIVGGTLLRWIVVSAIKQFKS